MSIVLFYFIYIIYFILFVLFILFYICFILFYIYLIYLFYFIDILFYSIFYFILFSWLLVNLLGNSTQTQRERIAWRCATRLLRSHSSTRSFNWPTPSRERVFNRCRRFKRTRYRLAGASAWNQMKPNETEWNQMKPNEPKWTQMNPNCCSHQYFWVACERIGAASKTDTFWRGRLSTAYT